jgi:hypothetical protein
MRTSSDWVVTVGGLLTAGGLALGGLLLLMAARGTPVGLGGPDVNAWAVTACLGLLGSGTLLLSFAGPRPVTDRVARIGLGLVAVGCLSLAASGLLAARLTTDALEDWPSVITGLGGIVLLPIGMVVLVLGWAGSPRSGSSDG